mgnify:CR=1 FL=1
MKITKYLLTALLFMGMVSNFTACKDDDKDSPQPVSTDTTSTGGGSQATNEELEKLGVDAIYTYDVKLNLGGSYEGKALQIEIVKIANEFGLDTAKFNKLIVDKEIVGYTYDPVDDRDVMTAITTNSKYWGHWFTASGQITAWSESVASDKGITYNGQAAVFCEYDVDTYTFAYGQYPGVITEDTKITVYEGLYSEDLDTKVIVKINFTIAKESLNPTSVGSQDITQDVVQNTDFSTDAFEVNTEALSLLGISSFSEASFIGYTSDTELTSNYSADPAGFFYSKDGYVGSYGDDASIFVIYNADEDKFGIGQMPNTCEAGTNVNVKFGIANEDYTKVYWVNLNVTIVGYQDPETAPTGDPESAEYTISFNKPYTSDYAAQEYDIADQLKNAFKMTNYQIFKAINNGELKMYLNEKTEELTYTAGTPGYWINASGEAVSYGDGIFYIELHSTETSKVFAFGNHPDNAPKNGSLATASNKLIVECNGVTVTYNVSYTLTAEEAAE